MTRAALAAVGVAIVAFVVWSSTPASRSADEPNPRDVFARVPDDMITGSTYITIPPNTTGPRGWQGPLLDATATAQQQFEESRIDAYRVTVTWTCFCFTHPGYASAYRVTVHDGKIVELTALGHASAGSDELVEIGTWDHVPHQHRWVEQWVPLERAFDEIAATSTANDKAYARFDPVSGVPQLLHTDSRADATDDQLSVVWRDFERLR